MTNTPTISHELGRWLDFAQACPRPQAAFFIRDFLTIHRPTDTSRQADARLQLLACDLMEYEAQQAQRPSSGYFTALAMEQFLSHTWTIDPPFKAAQKNPSMQKPDGNLNDTFFATPVLRARAWWAKNGQTIRDQAKPPREIENLCFRCGS